MTVVYVNFRTKEASFVGWSDKPIVVGPIFSIVDGRTYFTAGMSVAEIKALQRPFYQQLQLPHPSHFA